MQLADKKCTGTAPQNCSDGANPADAPLCGYTAEQYAETGLFLEPRGAFWCKELGTVKAAIYRAFGRLLADFDAAICRFFEESLACKSVELLGEWEHEYGLPSPCMGNYPTSLEGRQGMVCAARQALGISTSSQLELTLQTALNCPHLRIENYYEHAPMGGAMGMPLLQNDGVCLRGITAIGQPPSIHNVMGTFGGVGQPLTIYDPSYIPPESCPIIYHSAMGGWTGGMGQPLQYTDPVQWSLLTCMMQKHLPATVAWRVCND